MNITQSDILFVVILYKETLYQCSTYKTLISHYREVPLYIYDNSPAPMHNGLEFSPRINYVWDSSNPGLSYAYNRAADYAKNNGYPWIMVLDQDTSFCKGLVESYKQGIVKYPEIKLFVPVMMADKMIMSPYTTCVFRKSRQPVTGILSLSEYTAINSGMLINVDAMLSIGGYNESVWLDYSDYEFLERMRHRGVDQMYAVNSVCHQSFSDRIQSPEQKLSRYTIFCQCLKNCTRYQFSDNLFYLYIVLRRMLSLIIQMCSIKPAILFMKHYVRSNSINNE